MTLSESASGARSQERHVGAWLQGQAEYYLEKLHGEVEKQLEPFLNNKKTSEDWKKYRETLIGLTDVTHSHFDKLVQVWTQPLPPPSPPPPRPCGARTNPASPLTKSALRLQQKTKHFCNDGGLCYHCLHSLL